MPKVSVVIPVYNVEEYIPRCLDSLINQTLQDIEIICVNDGSTDNSLKVLEEYAAKDQRIKVLNQENVGVSQARNNGLKVVTGEFIGFCDPDDYVSLDYYEKLYNAVTTNGCDIAASGITKFRGDKYDEFLTFAEPKTAETYYDKLILLNAPNDSYIWNKIYKTSEFKKHNLEFIKGLIYEDIVFTSQVLCYLGKAVIVPEGQYYYCKRKGSLMRSKKNDKFKEKALEICTEFIESKGIPIQNVLTQVKKFKIFNLTIAKIKYEKDFTIVYILNFMRFKIKREIKEYGNKKSNK
jgi:glycosyltransferase involved in cell wall biosynthesis